MNHRKKILYILLIAFIILLASFLRLYRLGSMPFGIADDEVRIILSAYSIWHTGFDIQGHFLPLSVNLDASFSPVYIYLTAPFIGILGLSPFVGRLPFALLSIGSVLLVYFVAVHLSKKKAIGILSSIILAISPWGIQAGRAALDHNFALFFYLLAFYLFIRNKKQAFFSIPVFFLAFYSYHATKVFFVALLPLLLIWYRKELEKKQIITFIIAYALFLASFFIVTTTQNVTRQTVFFWNDTTTASKVVNYERGYNTAPHILKLIFNNKLTFFIREARENYLAAFSPGFLFLYGDPGENKQMFSLYTHGVFYIADILLLLLGFYFVTRFEKDKLLFALILIAPLPSTFTVDHAYLDRSIMLLPFFAILAGYGTYYTYFMLEKQSKNVKYGVITAFSLWYLFLVSSFLYQYFYRYSLTGAEGWNASSRDLSQFIIENKDKQVILDHATHTFFLQYALFSRLSATELQKDFNKFPKGQVNNITFIQNCNLGNKKQRLPSFPANSFYISPFECYYTATPSAVIRDRGERQRTIWKIY